MSSFTTRVELHSATSSDYETLHSEMEKEGFSTTITSDKAIAYHLPTAEYNKVGLKLTLDDVLTAAKRAAAKTKKEYSVLVTESNGRTWYNLPLVKKS